MAKLFDLPFSGRFSKVEKGAWLAAIIGGLTYGLAIIHALFTVDGHGVSTFVGKPPTLDFTNLWYGGKLALEGQVSVLFDVDGYRSGLERLFSAKLQPSEWSYPPSILLIGAPLGALPLYAAYTLWTGGTLAFLCLVARKAGVPPIGLLLLMLSPAVLVNIFFGHNGAATAALLCGGLLVAERRPWLAGLCFGLLTMKPHLGVLIPICLLAIGAWRAIGWAAFFSVLLIGITALLFGPEVWLEFRRVTQPLMVGVLEAPFGNGYQQNAGTVFATARWLGAHVLVAYSAQILVTVVASVLTWRLWRSKAELQDKVAGSALLTPFCTPYAYSYDLVMTAVALLILAYRWRPHWAMLPIWLLPLMVAPLNIYVGHVTPFVLAASLFGLYASRQSLRGIHHGEAEGAVMTEAATPHQG